MNPPFTVLRANSIASMKLDRRTLLKLAGAATLAGCADKVIADGDGEFDRTPDPEVPADDDGDASVPVAEEDASIEIVDDAGTGPDATVRADAGRSPDAGPGF